MWASAKNDINIFSVPLKIDSETTGLPKFIPFPTIEHLYLKTDRTLQQAFPGGLALNSITSTKTVDKRKKAMTIDMPLYGTYSGDLAGIHVFSILCFLGSKKHLGTPGTVLANLCIKGFMTIIVIE
jgi:hypothetical protein